MSHNTAAGCVRKPRRVFHAAMPHRTSHASNTGFFPASLPRICCYSREILTTCDRQTAGFFRAWGFSGTQPAAKNIAGLGLCTVAGAGFFEVSPVNGRGLFDVATVNVRSVVDKHSCNVEVAVRRRHVKRSRQRFLQKQAPDYSRTSPVSK